MKHLLLKLCFKNKCLHSLYITELQQISNYNTYNMIIIQKSQELWNFHIDRYEGVVYIAVSSMDS